MPQAAIRTAVDRLPAGLQPVAARWFERLAAEIPDGELRKDNVEPLTKLVACSEFAAATVLANLPTGVHAAEVQETLE